MKFSYKSKLNPLLVRSALVGSGRIFSAISSLAITALITRSLTVKDVGIFFLTQAVATFLSIIGQLGLNQTSVRLIARHRTLNKEREAFETGIDILFLGVFSGICLLLIYQYLSIIFSASFLFDQTSFEKNSIATGFWIFGLTLQILVAEVYRGFNRIWLATWYSGLFSSLLTLLGVGYIYIFNQTNSLDEYIWIAAIATTLSSLVGFWGFLKTSGFVFYFNLEKYNYILRMSWPTLLTNIGVYILNYSAIWLVGILGQPDEIAKYGTAARLLIFFSFANSLIYAVLPPTVVELYTRNDLMRLESVVRRSATVATLALAPLVLLVFCGPGFFLRLIFGEQYADAAGLLVILVAGAYFNIATGMRGQLLILTGHEKLEFALTGACLVISVFLMLLGFHFFGLIGLSWGATGGLIIQCVAEMYYVKKHLRILTFCHLPTRHLLKAG